MAKDPALAAFENKAITYARTGKLKELAECFERGVAPTRLGLIQNAAERGRLEAVEFLLARGADVNSMDEHGCRALHCAAATGRLELVRFLLDRGADPNLKDDTGATALYHARDGDHATVVDVLEPLTSKCIEYSIEAYPGNGDTPEAYFELRHAILDDFARGHSPAELRVLSLNSLLDFGAANGLSDMLQEGLWCFTSAADLMDVIDEAEIAVVLREADAVIRDQAARCGIDVRDKNPPVGGWGDFHSNLEARLAPLEERLSRLFPCNLPAGQEDPHDRLYAKTMRYVREHRDLFANPE